MVLVGGEGCTYHRQHQGVAREEAFITWPLTLDQVAQNAEFLGWQMVGTWCRPVPPRPSGNREPIAPTQVPMTIMWQYDVDRGEAGPINAVAGMHIVRPDEGEVAGQQHAFACRCMVAASTAFDPEHFGVGVPVRAETAFGVGGAEGHAEGSDQCLGITPAVARDGRDGHISHVSTCFSLCKTLSHHSATYTAGMTAILPVLFHDHFDPTWRRAFHRPIAHAGTVVAPYATIEARVFEAWLGQAESGLALTEGQTAVWREYLARQPQRLERLRKEAAAGRLCLVNSGETVQDSNLPFSEGLVRNFLVAQPLLHEIAGDDHPGLAIGWCEDAFGNSANYPQILRGVGCEVVAMVSYRVPPGEVWEGLDGTRLPSLDRIPRRSSMRFSKHPPCGACRGSGRQGDDACMACSGDGVQWLPGQDQAEVEALLERAIAEDRRLCASSTPEAEDDGTWSRIFVLLGSEELPPPTGLLAAMAAVARREPAYAPRSCTWADLWQRHRQRLMALAAAPGDGPSPDLNPASPGCMVTRLRMKQRVRGLARRLTEAESVQANASWRAGCPTAPVTELDEAWRLVVFNQFHDAITGTLVDGAYAEAQEMLDRAEALLTPHLPPPPPPSPVPAMAAGEAGSVRMGVIDVDYDRRGIRRLRVGDCELCAERTFSPVRPALRVGELTLEEDFGDAWGTRIASIDPQSCFVPLGDFHTAPEFGDGVLRWRGTYGGGDRKVRRLAWTVTVRPSADGRRLDFHAEIDWDCASRRLRVRFPLPGTGNSARWEIPYGHLHRCFDAKVMDHSNDHAHQNEFPMHHWIDVPASGGGGVALIAGDLPCARWWPGGVLDLSLLRSPESGFCQVESQYYEFWDNDGMRDTGRHALAWSLWPHAGELTAGELSRAADAWLRPAFVRPPFAIDGDVLVDAWKPAEDGNGWILRLHDASGEGTEVVLDFAEPYDVVPCDLLERSGRPGSVGVPGRGRGWRVHLHRHGICTVRLRTCR